MPIPTSCRKMSSRNDDFWLELSDARRSGRADADHRLAELHQRDIKTCI